ncbi:unnamed protein product [Dibothriocephalus latus]|uniref:Sec23/Sec24 beta-sandwich domain-containing protein n=1 Tax=Dibothriocephalus latus TaxID=60516 RepID=A0A3P7NQS5_DIBLA|nr:unnamed protein product [Dibothriocephalus latus]
MAESLRRDLIRYLTRRIGFEAVLRIRCTRGLNIQNFYGCFFVRSVDLLSLPNVNPDAGYAMQLEMTESLEEFQFVVLQVSIDLFLSFTTLFPAKRYPPSPLPGWLVGSPFLIRGSHRSPNWVQLGDEGRPRPRPA